MSLGNIVHFCTKKGYSFPISLTALVPGLLIYVNSYDHLPKISWDDCNYGKLLFFNLPVFSYQHPNDGQHVCMAGPRLQADCHVSSSGVYDALSQNGAELSHHVVVLVSDHLIEICRTRLIKGKHKYYL